MPLVNQKAEKIVKGMKRRASDFKKRYGEDDKKVMYATANKLAQKENLKVLYYKDFINIVEKKKRINKCT
tara:strand:+ start:20 stop:229 length:210 start_codon:yes stop_codon:yes gene_type:complete